MIGNIQAKIDALWRAVLELRTRVSIIASSGGGSGITQLTGDVTAGPGSGSEAATIAADSVTNTKLANMAADTFKGRAHGAGTGDAQDLTADQASDILDTAADPFVRTSAVGSGYTDEQAQDAVGGILDDGGDIDFTYDDATPKITAVVKSDAVTYAKLQNVGANSVLARAASSSGDVGETALSASQLLGRGSSGDITAITLGSGLAMSGTTLGASGGVGTTNVSFKSTDQTINNSNALTDDTALFMSLSANKTYWFELVLFIESDNTGDFLYTIDGPSGSAPSGATARWGHNTLNSAVAAWIAPLTTGAPTNLSPFGTTLTVGLASTTTTHGGFIVRGLVFMGANAGSVGLRWAQNVATSGATGTTVKAGSHFRFTQLN